MSTDDLGQTALSAISSLILAYGNRYASDYRSEGYDRDNIEANMKENLATVRALRKIRDELENLLVGAPL